MASVQHVEALGLDFGKGAGQRGQRCVEMRLRMLRHRVAHGGHPGLHMGGEEGLLLRQVGDPDVLARDQVAHHLEQAGQVVLGLGHRLLARQAQPAQVTAQARKRLVIEPL
jgi:hypothetical protein